MDRNLELKALGIRHAIPFSRYFLLNSFKYSEQIKKLYYDNERNKLYDKVNDYERKKELTKEREEMSNNLLSSVKHVNRNVNKMEEELKRKLKQFRGREAEDLDFVLQYWKKKVEIETIRVNELILENKLIERKKNQSISELSLLLVTSQTIINEAYKEIKDFKRRTRSLEREIHESSVFNIFEVQ